MNTFWLLAYIIAAAWMVYTYAGYPWLLRRQLKKLQQRRAAAGTTTGTTVPTQSGHSMSGSAATHANSTDTRRAPVTSSAGTAAHGRQGEHTGTVVDAIPLTDASSLPAIAVVIVARHAAHQIGPKIRSCLENRYPADRIRVLLAIDGDDEDTAQAAEALQDLRVTVQRHAQHRGKAACLNDAIARCTEEILILTDARQRLDPDAIAYLVQSLQQDPALAAVSGELRFEVPDGDFVGQGLDAYWRYEKWLRRTEGQVASTIGMTGALYALRRAAFRPIPPQTILDDVLIPMQAVLDGYRASFDARAIAYDLPSTSMAQERRRKIRTLAGNFQLIQLCPALVSPRRNPAFLGFFSHKVCRLLTPVALLIMLLASVVLAPVSLFFRFSLAAALLIIGLALLARQIPATRRWLPVRLSNTFIEMHLFIVYGFLEFLRNRNLHRWGG